MILLSFFFLLWVLGYPLSPLTTVCDLDSSLQGLCLLLKFSVSVYLSLDLTSGRKKRKSLLILLMKGFRCAVLFAEKVKLKKTLLSMILLLSWEQSLQTLMSMTCSSCLWGRSLDRTEENIEANRCSTSNTCICNPLLLESELTN